MAMKQRYLLAGIAATALAGLYAIGQGPAKEEAARYANSCIMLKGDTDRCDQVAKSLLDGATRVSFDKAMEQRQALKDQAKAQQVREESERNAKIAEAKADADAKFKTEGWWQVSDGVLVRWCTDANPCPGSASEHYSDYVWRAMVWCKDRSCGDIYARMNIERGGAVIGWTNDTAYGDLGQKVVLTFGSHLQGQAQIVEFKARG